MPSSITIRSEMARGCPPPRCVLSRMVKRKVRARVNFFNHVSGTVQSCCSKFQPSPFHTAPFLGNIRRVSPRAPLHGGPLHGGPLHGGPRHVLHSTEDHSTEDHSTEDHSTEDLSTEDHSGADRRASPSLWIRPEPRRGERRVRHVASWWVSIPDASLHDRPPPPPCLPDGPCWRSLDYFHLSLCLMWYFAHCCD